ncbi:uncharacterized protein LOC117297845 [Asterias rubens]|uniref:uncharacterized protein LOC117297845 n=1 Tax=Asterias rubens TaxID=7604 RepID=UPI001455243B|nr:uncharacterized protein LOC117297845 [Asterias rubens]
MHFGNFSGGAWAILVAALIVCTEADRKTCFCDLRYSTSRLVTGDSIDSLPVLYDLPNPSYTNWLSVGCKRVNGNCPNDCLNRAHVWLGTAANPSSHFTSGSGPNACEIVRRNAPPSNKIYVYASYDPSVCGGRSWQYITELCCWAISFPGYSPVYLHNPMCAQDCSPMGC